MPLFQIRSSHFSAIKLLLVFEKSLYVWREKRAPGSLGVACPGHRHREHRADGAPGADVSQGDWPGMEPHRHCQMAPVAPCLCSQALPCPPCAAQGLWVCSAPGLDTTAHSRGSHGWSTPGGCGALGASWYSPTSQHRFSAVGPQRSPGAVGLCSADGSSQWLCAVALFIQQCQCQGRAHKSSWTWDYCVNNLLGASVLQHEVCPMASLLP